MRFLFQILFRAKTLIKVCYVNIGWLVTGCDLLYFSPDKSHEGKQTSEGERREQGIERANNYCSTMEKKAAYVVIALALGIATRKLFLS